MSMINDFGKIIVEFTKPILCKGKSDTKLVCKSRWNKIWPCNFDIYLKILPVSKIWKFINLILVQSFPSWNFKVQISLNFLAKDFFLQNKYVHFTKNLAALLLNVNKKMTFIWKNFKFERFFWEKIIIVRLSHLAFIL